MPKMPEPFQIEKVIDGPALASRIFVDKTTAFRQARALAAVLEEHIGGTLSSFPRKQVFCPRNFLVPHAIQISLDQQDSPNMFCLSSAHAIANP